MIDQRAGEVVNRQAEPTVRDVRQVALKIAERIGQMELDLPITFDKWQRGRLRGEIVGARMALDLLEDVLLRGLRFDG